MARLLILVFVVAVVVLAARVVLDAGRATSGAVRARRRQQQRPGSHEWDRRTDQVKRQLKGFASADEPREAMVSWVESHVSVEAYVEPKTVMSPLSVVFVDAEGEWKRFPLAEDRFLRAMAKERGFRVFDASRTGYPPRMRRGRRDDEPKS